MKTALSFILAAVVGFARPSEAQVTGTPGTVVPGEVTSVALAESEMAVLKADGVFQGITAGLLTRSVDFQQNRDLVTLTLFAGQDVIEKIVYLVREVASTECGSVVSKATPIKRLANVSTLIVTDPSPDCQIEKTKAVLYRSFGMTEKMDGTIEMEGSLASPF